MATSRTTTKDAIADLYAKIEQINAELRAAHEELVRLKRGRGYVPQRPARQPVKADAALAKFCADYCRTKGTKSVPAYAVRAWRESQP